MANHAKNLTGMVDGFLTVVESTGERSPRGDVIWRVQCTCGMMFTQKASELFRKKSGREEQVPRSCGCKRQSRRIYESKYGEAGHLSGHRFGILQRQASHRGHVFTVTIEYLWDIFQQQDGLCALTGVPLALSRKNMLPGETIASLDRIRSELGYIPENVQWVHPTINFMKHAMAQEQFIEWCQRVSDRSRAGS